MLFELDEGKMDHELNIEITAREAWVIAQQLLKDMGLEDELSEIIDIAYNGIMIALIDGDFVHEVEEE